MIIYYKTGLTSVPGAVKSYIPDIMTMTTIRRFRYEDSLRRL